MRTISKIGVLLGLFVAGVSVWRWMIFYDSPFRLIIGLFLAVSLMAWGYIIDWMTLRDMSFDDMNKRIDSIGQELRGIKELNNLK